MSVKGKKVLHIDRNDHYGGLVEPLTPLGASVNRYQRICLGEYRIRT